METSDRIYSIRRPIAAFCAGAAVAVLGGLIGLGGAEFRLPLLIAIFELFPHRAIRINLLKSCHAGGIGNNASWTRTHDQRLQLHRRNRRHAGRWHHRRVGGGGDIGAHPEASHGPCHRPAAYRNCHSSSA